VDQTLSQKTLISVLAKDDADFAPPILLLLNFSERCKPIASLSNREATQRETIEEDAAKFLLLFAKPYLTEILNADSALRSDWVVYEGLCRHKINLLEIQGRRESARRTILHQETDRRSGLLFDEEYNLGLNVLTERERIGLIAIAAAGRTALENAEMTARSKLQLLHEQTVRDIGLVSAMSIEAFVREASAECDCFWLEMLRCFDKSAAVVLV
jgi:hypothetical protein